jgi:hypothetical protein
MGASPDSRGKQATKQCSVRNKPAALFDNVAEHALTYKPGFDSCCSERSREQLELKRDHPVDAYLILGYEPPSRDEREEALHSFLE